MSAATDLTVKQRLQRAIARPLSKGWPSELHRDVLTEIERLEFNLNACRGAAISERSPSHACAAILKITAEYDLTGKSRT